ncbi:MAG: pyruvate, phosphate dikinase, partial [Pseudomonadota bacterium]
MGEQTAKFVYVFGTDTTEGHAGLGDLLGGKGANLAEMARLGLPVPPGFTISTEVCTAYYANAHTLPDGLEHQVTAALAEVAATTGKKFGDANNPLLIAVRSGARASMPGMMDTILNLGLNDATVMGLAQRSQDKCFAFDSYRRFIQMYGDVVLNIDHGVFEDILENFKNLNGASLDTDLTADDWLEIINDYKEAVKTATGKPFPQDTNEQLWGAIRAVFGSWRNARADTYRRLHNIPESWGTAVNIQAMVFGNLGRSSATGVAFTRNPSTGAKELYGEFLINAQGEDVVAGIRTPQSLTEAARIYAGETLPSLEATMPETFGELKDVFERLEAHYRDMQDIEFTIESGRVWMLQTRAGKRTTQAALQIAVSLAQEGVITKREAVARVDAGALDQLLHPTLDPDCDHTVITQGLPASPGAAAGEIVFTADAAEAAKAQNRPCILVRMETSPEDIHGMHAAAGILTARGGMTSHAAVVARGMGRPCVSGAGALRIDVEASALKVADRQLAAGDVITIDGTTGQVLEGRAQMRQPKLSGAFSTLMGWADEFRRLRIRANADTQQDADVAIGFGAEGIGLCRTEHMFFDDARLLAMREMICAGDVASRQAALAKIQPMQRADFQGLFETMGERPVTIRLLDPPLHEFLPQTEAEQLALANSIGLEIDALKARIDQLSEFNPMLGFRGCRLAIRYPEICQMQARAIFEAAVAASAVSGRVVRPEVMIPLIVNRREFDILADIIRDCAAQG